MYGTVWPAPVAHCYRCFYPRRAFEPQTACLGIRERKRCPKRHAETHLAQQRKRSDQGCCCTGATSWHCTYITPLTIRCSPTWEQTRLFLIALEAITPIQVKRRGALSAPGHQVAKCTEHSVPVKVARRSRYDMRGDLAQPKPLSVRTHTPGEIIFGSDDQP